MLSQFNHRYEVLVLITAFWLPGILSVPNLARSGYWLSSRAPQNSTQGPIPEATKPCTADEATWWQNLRQAGRDAITARVRKDEAARKRSMKLYGQIMADAERLLPKKELNKLNDDIVASTERFFGMIREGQEKLYRAPVPDRRFMVLYLGRPGYSEEARKKKIGGAVDLRVEFRADGTVGGVNIVHGLGYGLDEKAAESVQRILFLPAIRDGVFVTVQSPIQVTFNIM